MLLNICRKEYEHERASVNGQKKEGKIEGERVNDARNKQGKETERMCVVRKKEREKEKNVCMMVYANSVKMCQIERIWGRALGAESNG